MQFEFAAAGYPAVSASLPDKPLGTSGSAISGVDLEVWSLSRSGDKAVLLVIALHNPGTSPVSTSSRAVALSSRGGNAARTVSGLSVVDGSGLKQYLAFMSDPNDDTTCVCSKLNFGDFTPDQRDYYAALVATPPGGVKSVTVVTGLGSVANVPLG